MAYDYREMFRTILSELQALDKLAARKASQEITGWVYRGKAVLQKRDRITWFLRFGQLKWADYLADAYQWYKSPGSRAAEALRWQEWVKAKAHQFDPPMAPDDAVNMNMAALRSSLEHYLSLPIPEIQGTVFLRQQPAFLLNEFKGLEKEWRDRQSHLLRPHPRDEGNESDEGDEIVLEFPDGWAWWRLGRSYCPDEAKAMGHCGNEAAGPDRPNDRILSLRHKVIVGKETFWEPFLTFIWDDDGLLGEMKGRGNEKPAPRYHPYIVALLERKDLVFGIKGGGYMPESNFSLKDLPPEQRERVKKANRGLVSALEMYRESRGSMTDELLQRITSRTTLTRDQWRPQEEAFVVDEYASPEWFISTEGNRWLKAQMMLAREDFSKHPDHEKHPEARVVEEGVRDLLAVLDEDERKAVVAKMPRIIQGYARLNFPSVLSSPGNLSFGSWPPEEEEDYKRMWGVLVSAWEAGVTKEMRQAALDRVRKFLGDNKRSPVRTNSTPRVVFPEASDPGFWEKPVLVEVALDDAVEVASSGNDEWEGFSIIIEDYRASPHGTALYDASAPYRKLTLPSDQKEALDRKMDAEGSRLDYNDFLAGRPYRYLRWLREEVPGIFEQEMTPGAWDEEKARAAFMRMLGKK